MIIGAADQSADDWIWRLEHMRDQCANMWKPDPNIMLAWSAKWEVERGAIVRQLRAINHLVDYLAVEAYLTWYGSTLAECEDRFGRMLLRAENLLEWSAEAGVWHKTVFLFNLSDRTWDPSWNNTYDDYHFVFGKDGAGREAIKDGYTYLWQCAQSITRRYGTMPAGFGFWSTNHVSPESSGMLEDLVGDQWYRFKA
jgi:hypothetical protein